MSPQEDNQDIKKLIYYAHKCTINFPVFNIGTKCKKCNRVPYDIEDNHFMKRHKQICMQCWYDIFYTYDIPQHKQIFCKEMMNIPESKVLKLLQCLEKYVLGFSYECIHKCNNCKKWAIDLEEKKFIKKERMCHQCLIQNKCLIPSTTTIKLGKRKGYGSKNKTVKKKSRKGLSKKKKRKK